MMVEDFSECGHAVRKARTQTYPSEWESQTLRNIVDQIWVWKVRATVPGNDVARDLYFHWLERLEKFFMAI